MATTALLRSDTVLPRYFYAMPFTHTWILCRTCSWGIMGSSNFPISERPAVASLCTAAPNIQFHMIYNRKEIFILQPCDRPVICPGCTLSLAQCELGLAPVSWIRISGYRENGSAPCDLLLKSRFEDFILANGPCERAGQKKM